MHALISREPVRDYVPESWISLVSVKREHYLAISHRHCAAGLLDYPMSDLRPETRIILERIQVTDAKTQLDITVPKSEHDRQLLGKTFFKMRIYIIILSERDMVLIVAVNVLGRAHVREALVLHEESQRLQRMCRELKGKQSLVKVLRKAQDLTMDVYGRSGDEDDLRELLDSPNIIGNLRIISVL